MMFSCVVCGRVFNGQNDAKPPVCPDCAAAAAAARQAGLTSREPRPETIQQCPQCGEVVRPHWTACPVCQSPLHGALASYGNPFTLPPSAEKEIGRDQRWSGVILICLAIAGIVGVVMTAISGYMRMNSDSLVVLFGAIVLAAMVGGGLIGRGPGKGSAGGAVGGALLGFLASVGTILGLLSLFVLIAISSFLFLILTCLQSLQK